MISQNEIEKAYPLKLDFKESFDVFNNDKLFEFCIHNKELRIERTAEGEITITIPIGGEGGNNEFTLSGLFFNWSKNNKDSGKFFGAGTGFLLKDGSMKSPDLAFVKMDHWQSITDKDKKKFLPLCPDFLVELRSETDRLAPLQKKMEEWVLNGTTLAWLIDPIEEKAYIYKSNKEVEIIKSFDEELSGEELLPGFKLCLKEFLL